MSAVTDQDLPGNVPAKAAARAAAAGQRPRVFLHIGEPKTGTTFLQELIWRNRAELAARGVVLPGHHPQDHFRATQDLHGIPIDPSDPTGNWKGEWAILAAEAKLASRVAVISHELLAAADEQEVRRAVTSLRSAEVHVVLTVRDIAALLPAEWQETVKHRNARRFDDWLSDVIDMESAAADRRQYGFWRVHDTAAILELWSRHVPPERVHVITAAPRNFDSGLLWRRFAGLLEVDPAAVDLGRARANASLGLPEIEFLRRMNQALSAEIPDWYYMWRVKEGVAHTAMAARPARGRLTLPAERLGWARDYADGLIAGLTSSGYDLVGDLEELRPPAESGASASRADQPAELVLDAAVEAAAALVLNEYWVEFPAAAPEPDVFTRSNFADRVALRIAASPWLKRTVRNITSRSSLVRRLRIVVWRALERPGSRGK
ncbi:MAG: hypothetical protein ACRDOK_05670 [Streptosporangiaceae bacterium]